jgi:predicted transcriptional regulator
VKAGFDMVARRGDKIILVKTLANIDAFKKDDAIILQLVAQFFGQDGSERGS